MKIKFLSLIIGLFTIISCPTQDGIFYIISKEKAPIPPFIAGTPTNFVIFEREVNDGDTTVKVPIVYVASGRLHWYARAEKGTGNPRWDLPEYAVPSRPWPGGVIIDLAVTSGDEGNYLYALCIKEDSMNIETKIYRIKSKFEPGEEIKWEEIELNSEIKAERHLFIQSIYSDPSSEWLFAGSTTLDMHSEKYAILCMKDTDKELVFLKKDTKLLSGAVYRNETEDLYYLSTKGAGIYQITKSSLSAGEFDSENNQFKGLELLEDTTPEANRNPTMTVMGMIKLEDPDSTIIAIDRTGGFIYEIKNGSFEKMLTTIPGDPPTEYFTQTRNYATGALALWKDEANERRLLVGRQLSLYNTTSENYTNGYIEFNLDPHSSLKKDAPLNDRDMISINFDYDTYSTSLGKYPINHMFQVPQEIDPQLVIFASTQAQGLWSYKERSDGSYWNAENN